MKTRVAVVFAIMAMVTAMLGVPASAQTGTGSIVSPAHDDEKKPGYAGPVQVDLAGADTGKYDLRVTALAWDNYYQSEIEYHYDGSDSQWSVHLPKPIYRAGRYRIRLVHAGSIHDELVIWIEPFAASITSPDHDAAFQVGKTFVANVRWSAVPAGTKVLTVINGPGDDKKCVAYVSHLGDETACRSFTLRAGDYTVHAKMAHPQTGYVRTLDTNRVDTVNAVNLSSGDTNRSAFFPLINDGFKDDVAVTWRANAPSRRSVSVADSKGRVVKRADLRSDPGGFDRWIWIGRDDEGKTVPVGVYTITVNARDAFGNRDSFTRKVEVKTGHRIENWHSWRAGWSPSNANATGDCSGYEGFGYFSLNCYGSGSATAKYNVPIHADAYDIEWVLRTEQFCCYNGPFEKFTERIDSDTYQIGITIGGTRGVDIYRARVDYKRRVRV